MKIQTLHNNKKNKGMYLETIIENTSADAQYIVFKKYLPIVIKEKSNNNIIYGKLLEKSTTDYYGLYNSFYFDFEAKQTINDYFLLSNIKKHQWDHLKLIHANKGISFIIVHFFQANLFFAIEFEKIATFNKQKIKKISIAQFKTEGFELKTKFPGFLDLKPYLDYYIKKYL